MNNSLTTDIVIGTSDIAQMAFEVILMVFVCTVNALTLIVVCLNRNLWTVPNMYIISLGFADLLSGLSLVYQMVFHVPEVKAVFDQNKYLCLFRHVVFFIAVAASILNMVLIAVDRWACITYPFAYERLATIPKAGMLIACAWVTAILVGSVPLYNNKWEHDVRCRFFKVLTLEYQVYVQGTFFVVCSIIIAACYGHIFSIAKTEREAILHTIITTNTLTDDTRMTKFKRDWELVVMFSVVFGVFFLCCVPAFIFIIVTYTAGVPETVNSFTIPLLMMNSGMNFIIYAVKNSQFRKAMKSTCLKCRTRTTLVRPVHISE